MQRPSPYPCTRPLSPRSALRSLQDSDGRQDHVHDSDRRYGLAPPHLKRTRSPDRLSPSGLRSISSLHRAPRSQVVPSSPSMLLSTSAPTYSSSHLLSSDPTMTGYRQAGGAQQDSPQSGLFATEPVFKTSSRQLQHQHFLPPLPSRLTGRQDSGSQYTSSPSTPSSPAVSQPFAVSPEPHFPHSQHPFPAHASIKKPTSLFQRPPQAFGSYTLTPAHAPAATAPLEDGTLTGPEGDNLFTYSLDTPGASMFASAKVPSALSQRRYSGQSLAHGSPAFLDQRFNSSAASQRSHLPLSPLRSRPPHALEELPRILNRGAHSWNTSTPSAHTDLSSPSSSSLPSPGAHQSSHDLQHDGHFLPSPALSEGWATVAWQPSLASRTAQSASLPPVLSRSATSTSSPRGERGKQQQQLAHQYSHSVFDHERTEEGSSTSSAFASSVSASPSLSTSSKRPRRWTTHVNEGESPATCSTTSSPVSVQLARAHSTDTSDPADKAAAQPQQAKLNHAEVMSRLNKKMRERLAVKAAAAAADPSYPHTIGASGLVGPAFSTTSSSGHPPRATIPATTAGAGIVSHQTICAKDG